MLSRLKSSIIKTPASPPMIEVPQAPGAPKVDPAEGLADFLMVKSVVPVEYRSKLKQYVIDQIKIARTFVGAHSDDKLMMLSKHTCTKDWIKRAFAEHSAKPAEIREAIEPGFFAGVGVVLGHGFDKSEEKKFIKDPSGKIIGITDPRQTTCNAALAKGEAFYGGKRRKTIKKKHQKKRKTLRRR